MITLWELWLIVWYDSFMLASLLICCVVAGHGLERRSLYWLRLSAAILAECL